jgi:hypothetical protein
MVGLVFFNAERHSPTPSPICNIAYCTDVCCSALSYEAEGEMFLFLQIAAAVSIGVFVAVGASAAFFERISR